MASRRAITRRERYAEDPDYRERELARKRRHRAAHKEELSDYNLRRRYGICLADYQALLARQGGRCATCRRKPKPKCPLQVDHCHKTGQVRGLLCNRCNTMLGMGDDDPRRLRAGIAYLEAAKRTAPMQCPQRHAPSVPAAGLLTARQTRPDHRAAPRPGQRPRARRDRASAAARRRRAGRTPRGSSSLRPAPP
jgi:Recombination endonuclease VII